MEPVIEAEAQENPRARWLAVRRTAVTATDAGAILGVSPYATPLDVFLEKRGEAPEVIQTERMEAGNRMQRPIIDWWAERREIEVVHEAPFCFRKSETDPLIGASLDAYRKDDGSPVDAKNIGWKKAVWGDEDTDKIPLQYAVQLAVQMHVTRAPRAFLPVLFGGNELIGYRMERDLALEKSIVEQCLAFWHDYVLKGITPAVDGTASWDEYLKRRFATNTDVILRAPVEMEEMAAAYAVALEQRDMAEMEVERIKNVFKLAIGENAGIESPHWKATWKRTADTMGVNFEQTSKDLSLALAARTGEPATKIFAAAAEKNKGITRAGSRRFLFNSKGSK